MKIDYRMRARGHVDSAKNLLAVSTVDHTIYACLKLRMAIEALAYERLQTYLQEAPNGAIEKWTPRDVLRELLEIDPYSDSSSILYAGIEDGSDMPSSDMQFMGGEHRFNIKWANASHNALGNFLHEQTLAQAYVGPVSQDKMAVKAEKIIEELERVLASTVFCSNIGVFHDWACACGHVLRRKEEFLKDNQEIVCRCKRIYKVSVKEGEFRVKLSQISFECPNCKIKNYVDRHLIGHGVRVTCVSCSSSYEVRQGFALCPIGVNTGP